MEIVLMLAALAFIVLVLVAFWKLHTKIGQPGWTCLIPFYGDYIRYNAFWGNGWLFLVPFGLGLLSLLPFLGFVFVIGEVVFYVMNCRKMAAAFGRGVGFTIGLVFLNVIFLMILAYSDSRYLGVPQDGWSYDQIRERAQQQNVRYQAPAGQRSAPNGVPPQAPAAPSAPANGGYPQAPVRRTPVSGDGSKPLGSAVPAQAGTRFCPKCGGACLPSERFCKRCGTKVD